MKKILFASDHAGFELKDKLKTYIKEKGYEVKDLGPNNSDISISYAKKGLELAHAISKEKNTIGVAICGTGLGISYAVNRVKHIRGARVTSIEDANLARKHNDANIIVFGARQISFEQAKLFIDEFLNTKFEGGRHQIRIEQLDK